MSYSFNVKAANKADAKAAVAVEFENVIASQPVHARDKAAALANADAVIDLLVDEAPAGQVISVSCNGYVGWNEVLRDDVSNPLNSASISTQAGYTPAN